MKKNIYLLAFLTINFINAQTKSNDYFTLYKGGDKYLKPLKYLMFDENLNNNMKTEDKELTYFHIKGERFMFDREKNKKDICSIDILKKIKLENPESLKKIVISFLKRKKKK